MAKSTFLQDFKAFAMKGNVIDMAVGVIIGGAFGKIVTSVVNDLIMPTVGMLVGGVNFTDLKLTMKEAVPEKLNEAGEVIEAAVPAVTLNYGNFLQQTFDFLIIAFCIFLMVKGIAKLNNLKKKEEEIPAPEPAPAPEPEPSAEEKLLTEIRDLLKNKK
ncbi:MAG: large-conductance mechanosensitive channel protein MscL [Bacteroidaceae bacterium]|nr:large-conductance mechanosensitive channel protein MscL [Bacteroidaceae bacterium]